MRDFTYEEKKWLVENEGNKPLYAHARHFNCSWKCVYANYTEMLETGEYVKIRKEVIVERKRRRALIGIKQLITIKKLVEQRRHEVESERTTNAVQVEASKSRPHIRGVRVIQNKS